ncbi:MAG: histidine kinase [Bacillales bacterium]|jgi:signal transduction histidine kinase|nr:histidine kinase [Bacillales bacterium]
MSTLNFRTNAKVESLVGRDLITSNTIAIFELVKNSYDAGATKVDIIFNNFNNPNINKVINNKESYIQIIDNGKGMSFEEVNKYWMELGTPYKEENKINNVRLRQDQLNTVVKRTVNGEKGIGRFGVDKIGSFLKLTSVDKDLIEKTIVYFDWNKFDDRNKMLEEVSCEYEVLGVDKGENSGLSLEIQNLRDDWYATDINKLKKSLSKFLSPVPIEQDEFRIFFTYKHAINGQIVEDREEIINDSFDYLKTKIFAELNENGLLYFEISDNHSVVETKEYHYYDDVSPFGAAKIEIFYLGPSDKSAFSKKMGIRTSDYGNIKIFRDNFRVMPYGEPHNDWLEIDKKHAQGIFRTFGTRDLVGHVIISLDPNKKNGVLKEATDRVGLIEDVQEFDEFKKFIWFLILTLQSFVFNRFKKESRETTRVLISETEGLRKEASTIINSIENIIERSPLPFKEKELVMLELKNTSDAFIKGINTVEKATEEIEKRIKIFSQISHKEGILFEMLHSIKNKLAVIDVQIKDFELELEIANVNISTSELEMAFNSIQRLVQGSLDKINSSKHKKGLFYLNSVVNDIISSYKKYFKANQINVFLNLVETDNIKVKCNPESIKIVFENLISNSTKALSETFNKKIFIETKLKSNSLEIFFSDNGSGIPKDKERFIFSLWSSNTDGTGIGLATAKDIIEDHSGEIFYIEQPEEDKVTTFMITLPLNSWSTKWVN